MCDFLPNPMVKFYGFRLVWIIFLECIYSKFVKIWSAIIKTVFNENLPPTISNNSYKLGPSNSITTKL